MANWTVCWHFQTICIPSDKFESDFCTFPLFKRKLESTPCGQIYVSSFYHYSCVYCGLIQMSSGLLLPKLDTEMVIQPVLSLLWNMDNFYNIARCGYEIQFEDVTRKWEIKHAKSKNKFTNIQNLEFQRKIIDGIVRNMLKFTIKPLI